MQRLLIALTAGGVAIGGAVHSPKPSPDLVVHEWGTFTTVAGKDGRATDWLPLGGPDDLPCFVEHFDDRAIGRIKGIKGAELNAIPDYATARRNLIGKVRMETPVLYFYTPATMRVDVRVDFPRGLMTEWYPHADNSQRMVNTESLRAGGLTSLKWSNVSIDAKGDERFPKSEEPSHYYAARATDAAPVRVSGQSEKFLFYRGVANFDVPLTVTVLGDSAVRVTNTGKSPLPFVIAFTNRDGKLSYRVERNVAGTVTMLESGRSATMADMRRELEALLTSAGLYAKEATAMVDTWHDTWFEKGTRVLYVYPHATVDEVLPLAITPRPATTARVFVGRMDVVTPQMQREVDRALHDNNSAMLASYGRLLGPIADRVLSETHDAGTRTHIQQILTAALANQVAKRTVCASN